MATLEALVPLAILLAVAVAALLQQVHAYCMLEIARRIAREDAVAALLQLVLSSVAAVACVLHA